jgi:hypothetical protein
MGKNRIDQFLTNFAMNRSTARMDTGGGGEIRTLVLHSLALLQVVD